MFKHSIWSCFCLIEEELLLLLQKIGAFVSGCFLDLGLWKACGCVFVRLCASLCVWERLGEAHCLVPLYEKVSFATKLQGANRLQVSKYVRWKYELETDQT
jgi:hypothetical protein